MLEDYAIPVRLIVVMATRARTKTPSAASDPSTDGVRHRMSRRNRQSSFGPSASLR